MINRKQQELNQLRIRNIKRAAQIMLIIGIIWASFVIVAREEKNHCYASGGTEELCQ